MAHVHDCDLEHWSSLTGLQVEDRHYFETCPKLHAHPYKNWDHTHDENGDVLNDTPRRRRPFAEREAYLLSAPWISKIKAKLQCDGTTGKSSMSTRVRCTKRAKYRYRALKRSWSDSGNFCWDHLPIANDMDEETRWKRWVAKNPPVWEESNDDQSTPTPAVEG